MFRVRSGHVAATLDMINSCTPAAISSPHSSDHYLRRKCCCCSLLLFLTKSNTLIDFKQWPPPPSDSQRAKKTHHWLQTSKTTQNQVCVCINLPLLQKKATIKRKMDDWQRWVHSRYEFVNTSKSEKLRPTFHYPQVVWRPTDYTTDDFVMDVKVQWRSFFRGQWGAQQRGREKGIRGNITVVER